MKETTKFTNTATKLIIPRVAAGVKKQTLPHTTPSQVWVDEEQRRLGLEPS